MYLPKVWLSWIRGNLCAVYYGCAAMSIAFYLYLEDFLQADGRTIRFTKSVVLTTAERDDMWSHT